MFEKIINYSVKNKLIVFLGVIALMVAGWTSLQQIAIDAVPDITNNQVQVVTVASTLAAEEVEQYVTYPIEAVMANIPGVTELRSISRYGLSVITIVFEDKMDIMKARQFVGEKIQLAAPSEHLFTIVDKSHLHIELQVPVADIAKIAIGDVFHFMPAGATDTLWGEIHLINDAIESSSNTIRVHGHLEEDAHADQLSVGERVFVTMAQRQ